MRRGVGCALKLVNRYHVKVRGNKPYRLVRKGSAAIGAMKKDGKPFPRRCASGRRPCDNSENIEEEEKKDQQLLHGTLVDPLKVLDVGSFVRSNP